MMFVKEGAMRRYWRKEVSMWAGCRCHDLEIISIISSLLVHKLRKESTTYVEENQTSDQVQPVRRQQAHDDRREGVVREDVAHRDGAAVGFDRVDGVLYAVVGDDAGDLRARMARERIGVVKEEKSNTRQSVCERRDKERNGTHEHVRRDQRERDHNHEVESMTSRWPVSQRKDKAADCAQLAGKFISSSLPKDEESKEEEGETHARERCSNT
jgi:hypothetical protein